MLSPSHTESSPPWVDPNDEALAVRLDLPVLISASASGAGEAVACRIHTASRSPSTRFVRAEASEFPSEAQRLLRHCSGLLDRAGGGSVFIADVDELPVKVQHVLLRTLGDLGGLPVRADAARLFTGTAVALWDRVQDGTFSDRLFYRLNVIHLVVNDARDATHAAETR